MKKIFFLFLAPVILFSCKSKKTESTANSQKKSIAHPEWIMQGNIYEVNIRQYTTEGTFNAFAKNLDRLKEMGVQTLWFMPINPISKLDRKGTMGSYYAVADYTSVNPEFGTLADWKQLVQTSHDKGFKVIIDWVPNHAGADHPWVINHPDFFVKDSTGKPAIPFDWTDTRQLDYNNTVMQDSMIEAMKYWITTTGIDGYRVDVAWNVPGQFWQKCIPQLKALKNEMFFLAEGDKPYLLTSGFDAFYPWELFHMMIKVAAGERPAFALDSIKAKYDTAYPKEAIPMYFTSNHDENSWNGTEYEKYGMMAEALAVFSLTWNGIPLIYSGQELPNRKRLEFFDKDAIAWTGVNELHSFYRTLLHLRKRNRALRACDPSAGTFMVSTSNDRSVLAYLRKKENEELLVLLNLSGEKTAFTILDKRPVGSFR